MVMSHLVSWKTQDFPSQKEHVAFNLSSECSQQDPFPFLLEKLGISKMRSSVLVRRGGEGQVITRPNGAERFSGMSCQ